MMLMKSNLYFGVPPAPKMPVIPGFSIVACHDDWLFARQGKKLFYVEIIDRTTQVFSRGVDGLVNGVKHHIRRSYRLFPRDPDGAIRTDKAITIPV
jgi:hypothetical protein